MDLTKEYPRSVKEKMFGVVQLARTIDKGKAEAQGTVGDYHYDCPMDKALFSFLGIEAAPLLSTIKSAKNDADIENYLRPIVAKKSQAELDAWNAEWLKSGPEAGSEGHKYFLSMRNDLAPDRTDITAWADLLDLDEKRPVPKPAAV